MVRDTQNAQFKTSLSLIWKLVACNNCSFCLWYPPTHQLFSLLHMTARIVYIRKNWFCVKTSEALYYKQNGSELLSRILDVSHGCVFLYVHLCHLLPIFLPRINYKHHLWYVFLSSYIWHVFYILFLSHFYSSFMIQSGLFLLRKLAKLRILLCLL